MNKFINTVTKLTTAGFKTTGTKERKFNNPKQPCKTAFSTTKATLKLFKAYN